MQYSWMIILCLFCGCLTNDQALELNKQKNKATIRETYYLRTVLHDDHLFILSSYGHFMHHFDCPCLKTKNKEEPHQLSPIIIEALPSVLIK